MLKRLRIRWKNHPQREDFQGQGRWKTTRRLICAFCVVESFLSHNPRPAIYEHEVFHSITGHRFVKILQSNTEKFAVVFRMHFKSNPPPPPPPLTHPDTHTEFLSIEQRQQLLFFVFFEILKQGKFYRPQQCLIRASEILSTRNV